MEFAVQKQSPLSDSGQDAQNLHRCLRFQAFPKLPSAYIGVLKGLGLQTFNLGTWTYIGFRDETQEKRLPHTVLGADFQTK